ncbi:MAG: extracellular solute-binding protein [Phycisphaerae bacterium]|nr:extracellular solute-binding protein [Phycisphaerae bacterium]MDW8263328.1 extracellular solute-binding protein [Phycisphaerales bacterium]
MSVSRAIRIVLAGICLAIVVWSFFDVGQRVVRRAMARAEKPVQLTVLHWGDPAEDRIVRDLVDRFARENPRIQVTRINPGDAGAMRNKLKTMMAAGDPPDVFYLPPDQLPELASLGLLAELDEYLAREPEQWKADFWPILLQAFRFDTGTDLIGRGPLYALPKDFTTAVFYFNKDLFEKAGIDWRDIQQNGWTWSRFESEMKKIRALDGTPGFEGREIYGTLLQLWPDTIRHILWTFGADFFHVDDSGRVDFRSVALSSPQAQAALEMIARMRLRDRTAFNASGIAKDGGQEFFLGNIGCTGPVGVWQVPKFKAITRFSWDILPSPYAAAPAGQIFYTGWAMSSRSRHPDEAFALLRFLCGREGQVQQARAQLAIPALRSVAMSDDFLSPPPPEDPQEPPIPKYAAHLFLEAVPYARLQQLPREQEWGRILEQGINRAIVTGQDTPAVAAEKIARDWLAELDSPLKRRRFEPMPWTAILSLTAAVAATVLFVLWLKARRERLGPLERATEIAGWVFISPWLIGFLALTLGPMIVSLLLSFSKWTGLNPISQAQSVGLANYAQLFTRDREFYQSLKVTAYYVLLGVPVTQLAALAVALLMNHNVRGIGIFRTIYFVPSVVSGVAMAVLWLQLYNNDYGLINTVLRPITGLFGKNPPNWFGVDTTVDPPVNDAAVWAIPAFVLMGLWGVGGGMIIYLAGLKGIPASLYEAATIDGAGPARRLWNVTLPQLSPLIFYNFVMGIIGSFQVFTQAYTMTGPGPDNATLFYVLNLYRTAFEFHNMGYASAMAWVLFVIVLILTLLVFRGSRNLVYYEGLKL